MCLGRRDDRELGGDRGVSGFRPRVVGDDRSNRGHDVHGVPGRDAGEGREKAGIVTGEVREMAVIERIEQRSGRVVSRAKLSAKVVLKNRSANQALRLFGGKIQYLDVQGQPIKLEGTLRALALRLSASGSDLLDPGQEAIQPMDVDFPAEALRAKKVKEIRLDLVYIPVPYCDETVRLNVTIGGP